MNEIANPHTGPNATPYTMIGSDDAGVTDPPIGISKSFNCESTNANARQMPPEDILRIYSRD